MKKIIYILGLALFMFSCQDVNDDFEGYDDLTKPKNVVSYNYKFSPSSDIKDITDALNANKNQEDSITAKTLTTKKMFGEGAEAADLVHYLFIKRFATADVGSSVSFTFPRDIGVAPEVKDTILTEQYVCALINGRKQWIFDPSYLISLSEENYRVVVDYVKNNISGPDNPNVIDSRGNAEFYYGFNYYFKNVTYRDKDRIKDATYPAAATTEEKVAFMHQRTIEALNIFLNHTYPDAPTLVNGVEQKAKITFKIFGEPEVGDSMWEYTLQNMGNKEWKYIERKKP